MNLLDNFQRYIRRNELAAPEDFILLTVSGGVDSMVMLSLFVRSGYRVGVAHCNFQLRGVESEEDEELVRREAEKYGVPWYNKRFDTKGRDGAHGRIDGNGRTAAALRLVRRIEPRARLHGGSHRPPHRRLDRNLLHQPVARHRPAGSDGDHHPCREADPPADVRFAQGHPRIRRSTTHSLPGRFVEPLDQIPAQQDPPGTRTPHQGDQSQVHRPDASATSAV